MQIQVKKRLICNILHIYQSKNSIYDTLNEPNIIGNRLKFDK